MKIAFLPNRLVLLLGVGEPDSLHVNALLSIGIVVAVFLNPLVLHWLADLPHFCLFEQFLGIPCPACDITGALAALSNMEVRRSLRIQPCGLFIALIGVLQIATRIAYLGRQMTLVLANKTIDLLERGVVFLLLAFWLYRLINI